MKQSLCFLAMSFVIFLISCSPTTKEDYLTEYSEFIVSVEEQERSGDIENWDELDKKQKYYSTELYDKFEDELTLGEVMKVSAYKIRYEAQKHKKSIFDKIFNNQDVEKIKSELKEYIQKDLDKDVDLLIKEAQKVSDEFGKAIEELARELEQELEDVD